MPTFYKQNTPMGHLPIIKRRPICIHLQHHSQLIRSRTGEENYTDSYFYCAKLQRRLRRRECRDCKLYTAL